MKKVNYLVLLIVVAFMFSGCAVNKAPFQDYPAVTEVQLNQANYRIVGTAQGYSRQVYVFGIGGLSQKSLKENAIMDMYENANLQGSQAIVNITTALTVSGVLPFYESKRASARGTIIEFLPDNEQPFQSTISSHNTSTHRTIHVEENEEQSTQKTLKREQGQQETRVETIVKKLSVDNSPENKYYLAWLIKTGALTKDKVKLAEIQTVFSLEELAQLSNTSSTSELYKNMKGFDTILRSYSKQR